MKQEMPSTYIAFKHMSKVKVSKLKYPRSTKSPRKMKFWLPVPETVLTPIAESRPELPPREL